MHRIRTIQLVVVVACAFAVSGVARADRVRQFKYMGGHPLAAGAYCHIQAPHVHVLAPAGGNQRKAKLEYRVYDDHYHFVGDPVARGYDGDRAGYYGPHPIAVDAVVGVHVDGRPHDIEYCYLEGPHFHAYAPPSDLTFEVKGGVYWYVGAYPPEFERGKPTLVKVNPIYAELDYERPIVEVDPPVAYVGPIVEVRAPIVEVDAPAAVVTGGIDVDVHIPTPTLTVELGVPGVLVVDGDDGHHHHGGRHFKKGRKHHRSVFQRSHRGSRRAVHKRRVKSIRHH